jgi:hypothetical protein
MSNVPNCLKFCNEADGFTVGHAFTPHRLNSHNVAQSPNEFALLVGGFAFFGFELVVNLRVQ